MPDLSDRTARENDLAAKLFAAFVALRKSIVSGSPDWSAFKDATQAAIVDSLSSTFAAAASQLATMHGEGRGDQIDATSSAYAFGAGVANKLAVDATANTQAALNEARGEVGAFADSYWLSRERANSIAITETTRAISAGENFAAAALAVILLRVVAWFWETEEDDSVCSICRPLNGQRDPAVEQPAHPGCRCRKRYDFSKPLFGAAA